MEGSRAEVEKRMTQEGPRRVESLTVHLTLPSELNSEQRLLLQRVAAQCPVKRSLDPQIEINLNWN